MTAPFFPAICELAPPVVTQPGAGRSITGAGTLNTVCPSSLGGRFAGVAVSPRRLGVNPRACRGSSARGSSPVNFPGGSRRPGFSPLSGQRSDAAPSAANIIGDDGRGSLPVRQDPAFAAALDPFAWCGDTQPSDRKGCSDHLRARGPVVSNSAPRATP